MINPFNLIRTILETVEWQAHQRILSHDFDFRLIEVEEEQEVFEPSPAVRRGPAGDSPPEVCDDGPLRQSPSGGRPTSELLLDAADEVESAVITYPGDNGWRLIDELRARAILLEGIGD